MQINMIKGFNKNVDMTIVLKPMLKMMMGNSYNYIIKTILVLSIKQATLFKRLGDIRPAFVTPLNQTLVLWEPFSSRNTVDFF